MSSNSPQQVLRRIRRPVAPSLLRLAEDCMFRMFHAPRARIWKYPGLMHRYATADIFGSLVNNRNHGTTFFVSRKWSRCCLVLLRINGERIGAIFHRENHRFEIVNLPERIPQRAYDGTVIDGFLDVSSGVAVFHAMDPIRFMGRWLGSSALLSDRRCMISDLFARGRSDELSIVNLSSSPGIERSSELDKTSIVYMRTRQGVYRAYIVCCTDAPCSYTDAIDDDYTVEDDIEA